MSTTADDFVDATTFDSVPQHHGATDGLFVKTALGLSVITGIEVAWTYIPWADGTLFTFLEVGGLLLLMAFKFFMVANVFMHLKWDSKLLTGFFYFGVVLAVIVYLVVLFTFQFFSSGSPPYA